MRIGDFTKVSALEDGFGLHTLYVDHKNVYMLQTDCLRRLHIKSSSNFQHRLYKFKTKIYEKAKDGRYMHQNVISVEGLKLIAQIVNNEHSESFIKFLDTLNVEEIVEKIVNDDAPEYVPEDKLMERLIEITEEFKERQEANSYIKKESIRLQKQMAETINELNKFKHFLKVIEVRY